MSLKLRLQRHGKKGKPFFHIVAADARAPRDGKFIERLGSYNPNTNPATIVLDNKKALTWLQNGAQPTETMRAILSYRGVLYALHLQKGVAKGALTQEQADAKLASWTEVKDSKIQAKRDGLLKGKEEVLRSQLKHEKEVNENRLKALAAANEVATAPEVEEAPVVAQAEEVQAEEAPAVEVQAEEAPVAQAEETPAVETPAEEAPAADAAAEESTEA
jgi:small subunit ribosomal protein S16